ncbi:LPXTG cell wall anchor domain-containing protein [Streptomyces sp. NPDC086787]|uniref:LPXTG cell wall anchor domain-containing protein n=1 Tax=Streptomyces sp. NPDC086787 TaxID=3365759 RepID=UPI003828D015
MISDPRVHTRRWASRHPVYTGLLVGVLFYVVELVATGEALGTLPFAIGIGAIFALAALSQRRRRKKHNLPL